MNQRYPETKEILTKAGYQLDKDMDAAVNETGLQLIIYEEKETGKLPAAFQAEQILITRFVKEAAKSVNRRFGSECE